MVNHVTLSAETLATVLGALEGAQVVVDAHVHRQIVSVVENFVAVRHRAGKTWPALVILQVSLKAALEVKDFVTALVRALKDLSVGLVTQASN